MNTINEMFRMVIYLNESAPGVACRFTDPDGERSGKSGWSFGDCQFDTQNNSRALACLSECGFTHDEIDGIVRQSIDVKPLEAKLKAHADIIKKYDMAQLQHCLDAAEQFLKNYGIAVADGEALLALADTINQYGSLGNGTAAGCRKVGRPVTADDILKIKLTWKYAQSSKKKYEDTERRSANVKKVWQEMSHVA